MIFEDLRYDEQIAPDSGHFQGEPMTQSDSDAELKKLAREVARAVGPEAMPDGIAAWCVWFVRLLADGRPVTPAQVAALAQISIDTATEMVDRMESAGLVELDGRGSVVEMILTLNSTVHQVEFGGRTMHVWSALDTLYTPTLLSRTMRVVSECPMTGKYVRLTVTPGGVTRVSPPEAHVSVPVLPEGELETYMGASGRFCANARFFASREAASRWLGERDDCRLLDVNEAFALAHAVWGAPLLNAAEKAAYA